MSDESTTHVEPRARRPKNLYLDHDLMEKATRMCSLKGESLSLMIERLVDRTVKTFEKKHGEITSGNPIGE